MTRAVCIFGLAFSVGIGVYAATVNDFRLYVGAALAAFGFWMLGRDEEWAE